MVFFKFLFAFIISIGSATFYPENYMDSRQHFLNQGRQLQDIYPFLISASEKVANSKGANLSIDSLYIPQSQGKKKRLLIVTSGIHGVEAFAGSAIQNEFLKSLNKDWFDHMGLLVVHAVNPYGFHFETRVDEENVDLNRNLGATSKHFESFNEKYEDFESFLNPKKPLKMGWLQDFKLFTKSIYNLITKGRKTIAQVALGGQYQNPKGMYFGGSQLQINHLALQRLFAEFGQSYEVIVHIDLHTGYGKKGVLHIFSNKKLADRPGFTQLMQGYEVDLGSDNNFYEANGDFSEFTLRQFPEKELVIPITFEFGTMDSQTTMGGFFSLRNMIFENQGRMQGYANEKSEKAIKKDFLEMFNPSDQNWRHKVISEGVNRLQEISARIEDL